MKFKDRRSFLKSGAAVTASITAGLYPGRIFAQESSDFKRIVYRELGSTGFKASEVGFGAMNTRDGDLIKAAYDSGINFFDTAHGYMGGENEKIVGKALKSVRDKIFLVTKVPKTSPDEMRRNMETSLRRLQTDYVDIMFLHITRSRDQILNEDYIKTFEEAKKKGLCRFVGVSTHSNQAEVLDAAVESKFWDSVLTGYNFTSPDNVGPAIERARKAGLAIIAMKTLVKGKGYPEGASKNITSNQAALKWVLQNPYVDTTIPGMTAFEHLADDLNVMGMRLSFFDRRGLYRYGQSLEGAYCRGVAGCTGCQEQCPKGVEICELNRCLGYAYGYGNIELARENYAELPVVSRVDTCSECDECTVTCINGLNLTETVKRARALFT